jgi:DNA-binding response OmpR family regulator
MSRALKIVVADDENDLRDHMKWALTHLGHDVLLAEDGEQLVEVCRACSPDLVITDRRMPRLDGLAAAAEINRVRPTPVILVSATLDGSLAHPGHGFLVACLCKPVALAQLQVAIETATRPGPPPQPSTC